MFRLLTNLKPKNYKDGAAIFGCFATTALTFGYIYLDNEMNRQRIRNLQKQHSIENQKHVSK